MESLKKDKQNVTCINCGELGHYYKNCCEPVISCGVILIKKKNYNKEAISNFLKKKHNLNTFILNSSETNKDNDVKFLMIMRKHSLGYIEFIRGKYNPDDFDRIISIFRQMTENEIKKISVMTFEELWKDFWGIEEKITTLISEYNKSKLKFEKISSSADLKIPFYVKNTKILWAHAEWGFPKGRRNKNEDNVTCAIREFEEESGFTKDDYVMCNNLEPIIEDLLGTNNIRYRHIYFIALATNGKIPKINFSNKTQSCEIGDIKFLTFEEANKIVRPFHKRRKNILEILNSFFGNI